MTELSPGAATKGAKCEQLEKIVIGNDVEKFFQVGVQLPPREKEKLIGFLRKNIAVFAWSVYEALRVDLDFIFKCQFIYPPQKATTSMLIQKTF